MKRSKRGVSIRLRVIRETNAVKTVILLDNTRFLATGCRTIKINQPPFRQLIHMLNISGMESYLVLKGKVANSILGKGCRFAEINLYSMGVLLISL